MNNDVSLDEIRVVIEFFNKRFPHHIGTLKLEIVEELTKEYSLDKVILGIS